jgi:hypothetical protein
LKEQDRNAKADFKNVLDLARQGGLENGFDEGDFFAGPDAVVGRKSPAMDVADVSGPKRTVQDAFQECFPNHGLRRMRQVQIMG